MNAEYGQLNLAMKYAIMGRKMMERFDVVINMLIALSYGAREQRRRFADCDPSLNI